VRAILSSFACARTGRASNPKSSAAALPVPTLKNSRLDKPIEVASCQAHHERSCAISFNCQIRVGNLRKEISQHARTSKAKCPLNFSKEQIFRETWPHMAGVIWV
jgi:hypothetical protein